MATYIGNTPTLQATQNRDRYEALEGQTTFGTSSYTPGYVDVYLNGIKLDVADFSASTGYSVELVVPCTAGDLLEVVGYSAFEVAAIEGGKVRFTYVATVQGQTTFTGPSLTDYDIDVFMNGVLLAQTDYNAVGTTITLYEAASLNDELVVLGTKSFSVADTVSASSGGTFQNNITVSGNVDAATFTQGGQPLEAGAKEGIFWENNTTITSSYSITAGKNAGTFGPVTIADGVTVTVPDGSTWTIV